MQPWSFSLPFVILTSMSLVNKHVRLINLKAVGMNGREGVVLPQPASTAERVQVLLSETTPALGDSRTVSLKPANLEIILGEPTLALGDKNDNNDTKAARPRPAAMGARPGAFKLGYDWREVLPGQDLPRGLEIMASLEEGVKTIARIPRRWKIDVFVNADDHVRFDVTRTTTVLGVIERVKQERQIPPGGWALAVDGERWCDGDSASIEKAKLFGSRITLEQI